MNTLARTLAFTLTAFALALASAPAAAKGRHGGGHGWHGQQHHLHHGHHHHHRHRVPGVFWGGAGIGIGLAAIHHYHRPWPGYVVVPPPVAYLDAPPPVVALREPVAPRVPDPVVYPSRGQSPEQTEADRQDCNRWATTQPSAMGDAGVFHRATIACLEGRGYTVR